ncbi:MAG: DUF6873 family GME fold protein [Peptostreptococcaceae bacterium]
MNFTKNSFTVDGKLRLALVDTRITSDMECALNNLNISIIKSSECSNTYSAIKYHPDISVCKLNDNNIVVAPNVYNYYNNELKKHGFNVIKGDSVIQNKYPYNIHYNIAILGKFAIHNFKYTDKKILNYLKTNNFELIDVKQGYSKCSICIVDDNSIITSDEGICDKVKEYNIDCLLIEKGFIDLFDMNYGFIGGCSGLISDKDLAFFGNIKTHPNHEDILNFISSKNKNVICLSNDNLLDLGSIIPLMTY